MLATSACCAPCTREWRASWPHCVNTLDPDPALVLVRRLPGGAQFLTRRSVKRFAGAACKMALPALQKLGVLIGGTERLAAALRTAVRKPPPYCPAPCAEALAWLEVHGAPRRSARIAGGAGKAAGAAAMKRKRQGGA